MTDWFTKNPLNGEGHSARKKCCVQLINSTHLSYGGNTKSYMHSTGASNCILTTIHGSHLSSRCIARTLAYILPLQQWNWDGGVDEAVVLRYGYSMFAAIGAMGIIRLVNSISLACQGASKAQVTQRAWRSVLGVTPVEKIIFTSIVILLNNSANL